jgi:methanethiol S-methyltransferase
LLFSLNVWAYVRLAKREESALAERFGEEYQAYRQRVPMWLPRLRNWREFIHSLLFAYQAIAWSDRVYVTTTSS